MSFKITTMELAALVCGFSSVACKALDEVSIADLKTRKEDFNKEAGTKTKDACSVVADKVNESEKHVNAGSHSEGPAQFKKEFTEATEKFAHPGGEYYKSARDKVAELIKSDYAPKLQDCENKLKELLEAWSKAQSSPEKTENLDTLKTKADAYVTATQELKSAPDAASVFDKLFESVDTQLLSKYTTTMVDQTGKYEKFSKDTMKYLMDRIAVIAEKFGTARKEIAVLKNQASAYGIVNNAEVNTELVKCYNEHCAKLDEDSRKNSKKMIELLTKVKEDISKFGADLSDFARGASDADLIFKHWLQSLTAVIDESYATVACSGARVGFVTGWFVKDEMLEDYCKTTENFCDKIATSLKEKCTFAGAKASSTVTGAGEATDAPAAETKAEETPFYNTWWFYTLCIGAGLLILGGVAFAVMSSSK
ncbi:hypothetical protein PAPHI01_2109 [Pancytospora philotis]|nr:hypothetical protein PAPHI01_2109 [Pancytospora philotis]